MGRGSDTRMYAPRSESSQMYSSANEDESKYNPTSPEDNEKRAEAKKLKEEEAKKKAKDIKHIKIKPNQGLGAGPGLETEPGLDDGNKRDDEREIGLQGGPAGSRGHLLDLATGAKTGTGSAMGTGNSAVRTGEPMDGAWSTLLKETRYQRYPGDPPLDEYEPQYHQQGEGLRAYSKEGVKCRQCGEISDDTADWNADGKCLNCKMEATGGPKHASEPMADAWSDLLKYDPDEELNDYITCAGCGTHGPLFSEKEIEAARDSGYKDKRRYFNITHGNFSYNDLINYHHETLHRQPEGQESPALCQHCEGVVNNNEHLFKEGMEYHPENELPPENIEYLHSEFDKSPTAGIPMPPLQDFFDRRDFYIQPTNVQTGEPMADAWSELLKRETRGTIEGRRRREKRREFRPSTGQFKRPPGGQSPVGATMRRFRAHMRGIKGGKKTGLMKPHLAVEMSHRGIATKQPMSKDPQKYRQYMGQQEAKKILGNVRTTYSPHARHSARSFTAGPTGGGRLTGLLPGQSGQMRQPSLQRLRQPRMPRMPRMQTPQMPSIPQMAPPMSSVPSMPAPSSSMMMSDERTQSDLLKANRHANRTEMLALMRMLIQAQRAKANMKKSKTNFYDGNVPQHASPVHNYEDEEEKNDGPTQNLETNSSRLGLDPAGYLSGKRGHSG
jgi:hypothetical protein